MLHVDDIRMFSALPICLSGFKHQFVKPMRGFFPKKIAVGLVFSVIMCISYSNCQRVAINSERKELVPSLVIIWMFSVFICMYFVSEKSTRKWYERLCFS